jgi:hypothetical protein
MNMKNAVPIPVKVPWTPEVWKKSRLIDIAANDLLVEFWADWERTLCASPRCRKYFNDLVASMLLPGTPLDRCRRNPQYSLALSIVMSQPMTADLVGALLDHLRECSLKQSGYFTSPLQWFEALTVACNFSEYAIENFSAKDQKELGNLIQRLRHTSLGALLLALNVHFGVATAERW